MNGSGMDILEDRANVASKYTEVDRAIDNLVKSGKLWAAPRRDSMPLMMGRPYPDYGMISRFFLA